MKHLLSSTLALAALVMLGACSSDDDIATATGGVTNNNENVPVAFQNYVGRDITTRGTIEDISTIGTKGFGVFACYTDGKAYQTAETTPVPNPLTDTETNFSDNFMSNQQVSANGTTTENITAWTYSPLKYWPGKTTERVSFLAYAPYSTDYATLYGVTEITDGNITTGTAATSGDLTYIHHEVKSTPKDQVDLMWNTTNALNQFLYPSADGKSWVHSGNFNKELGGDDFTSAGTTTAEGQTGTALRQNMKFAHATARIAIAITSGALRSKLNFEQPAQKTTTYKNDVKPNANWTKTDGTPTTTTKAVKSDAKLIIKDVKLLGAVPENGGNGIKFDGSPTGTFYKEGYLNLNNNKAAGTNGFYAPVWAGVSTSEKLAFDFSMTNNDDDKVFVDGFLGNNSTFYTSDKATTTGNKVWTPAKATDANDGRTLTAATSRDDATANNVVIGSGKITTTITVNSYVDPDDANNKAEETITEYSFTPDKANFVGTNLDQYMFVIPQNFKDESGNNLYAYLEYELVYTDQTNDPKGYALTHEEDGTEKPLTYYAYGKIEKNFVGGHSYVIVMNIGGASYTDGDYNPEVKPNDPKTFQPIQFTVEEVTGWGDEEDPDASL